MVPTERHILICLIAGSKYPKENSSFSCFQSCWMHCLELPTLHQVALIGFTHWVKKWAAKQTPLQLCLHLSCKYLKIFQLLKHLFCPGHKNRWRQSSKGLLHPSYSIWNGGMPWFHSELHLTHAKCQDSCSSGLPCLVKGALSRACPH